MSVAPAWSTESRREGASRHVDVSLVEAKRSPGLPTPADVGAELPLMHTR